MAFTNDQNAALSAKLDGSFVKPPPKGKYGSYVEGWRVIAEANRIFGFDGWSYSVDALTVTNAGQRGDTHAIGYLATITVHVGDVFRQDVGHGQGHSKSEGDAHDSAVKEAVTDGLKRCLRTFGNPFGLALYDKAQEGVERGAPPAEAPKRTESEKASPPGLADNLMLTLSRARSGEELDEIKNDPDFKARWAELSNADKARVAGHGRMAAAKFGPLTMAG